MHHRRYVFFVLLGVFALVLASCPGDPVDTEDENGVAPTDDRLIVAISAQPDQLDPHRTTAHASFQVLENVYDTLVTPDENLEFVGQLAEDWDVSEDQLTWTFTLREGVTFHDGTPLTADDVVYSYRRIIDEELANAFRFATVEEVIAEDDRTVVLQLSEPTPNLLSNIGAFKGMAILPEGAGDDLDLATEANGTGPFMLETVAPDRIVITANPEYWGDGPFVGEVVYRFISEPTTAMTELRAGDVHFTDNVPPHQVEELEGADDIVLGREPSVDYWYMTMNFDVEPFGDDRVRQAVALALDRQAIAEAAHFDAATVNQTAIPEASFWYHEYAPFERDLDEASRLLEDAGATGITMGLMVTDEFPQTIDVAQVIAANLDEVGIDVDIQVEEFATWLDRQGEGDYDAFMLGWVGNIDPFDFYHAQHLCAGGFNFHNYCSEETDQLLEAAAREIDENDRKQLYDQASEQIVDDKSYIYLYNPDAVYAWVPEMTGWEVRPDRKLNFENVRLGD
jgi:peptide/nickel transport system substrate-binding protein